MLIELAMGTPAGRGPSTPTRTCSSTTRWPATSATGGTGTCGDTYADDTQMSLAVAQAMVEGRPWTADTLAERPCRPACCTPTRGTHTVGKSGSAAIFEGRD
jgi:hypothetical protein